MSNSATTKATIYFPMVSVVDDAKFVSTLADTVNAVYAEAENGIFITGYKRTSPSEIIDLIRHGQLAVMSLDTSQKIAGCIFVKRLSLTHGEFGMMAIDSIYRGRGFGKQLVTFAEAHCRGQGCTTMRAELLVPTTFVHPFKERLEAWYLRMGYMIVKLGQFDQEYPALAPLLTGPAEYRILEKVL
ncbi:Ribosomal protein S18 acetylase RimI [Geosmithia morbida]|uniref:Ribosomal protein S18 acetylase RimI n=1 Tax=Geosmithia morbida TaxID=1094350 RepID=A0A9P5CZ04_9HYPO|nr:Ribosomal protein S18 acetylase RimI [Geosmithia morbida]KAF4119942.1 Ribosomal protein S18 acetylase RimI [Geosmithia morbida]